MRDFTVLQLRDSSEWLRFRKRFITSTDAPVILQASPWKGPAQLWAEKLNLLEEAPRTEIMQQGIDLESWILAKVPEQFPDLPPLKPAKDFYLSNRFHNFACSLDAWAQEERTIVEIKTASKHIYWKMDGKLEVPIYYKIQVNFQMLVTGFSKAYVVVFFRDTKELHCLEVRSDPVLQDNIISGCKNFWACMKSRTPPMPDHIAHPHSEMQAMYLYYFETEPKQIELKGTEELDQMLADPHDGVVETLKIVGRFQGASHVLTDKHEVAISLHPSQQRVTLFVRERSV